MSSRPTPRPDGRSHIGAVAERTGMSLRTLRHYDEIGLVTPSARSEGGFRLYTEADVERILLIRRMKPLGFTLEQMRELLELTEEMAVDVPTAASSERLGEITLEAERRRADLERKVAMADEFLERLRELAPGDRPEAD